MLGSIFTIAGNAVKSKKDFVKTRVNIEIDMAKVCEISFLTGKTTKQSVVDFAIDETLKMLEQEVFKRKLRHAINQQN